MSAMRPGTRGRVAMRTICFIGATVFFLTASPPEALEAQAYGEIGIALGEHPELVEIEDLDGNPVSLARYAQGRPVLIEFWARWCENCEALLPQMRDVYSRYKDQIEFLAVSVAVAQTPRSVKRHLAEHPVDFPTLWDVGGRAVRAFRAPATSYVVALDKDGQVVYTGTGPEQDIEAAVLRAIGETE